MNEILTVSEVCTELKMNRTKIIKLITSGQLKASKIGRNYRVKRSDIDRMIEDGVVK